MTVVPIKKEKLTDQVADSLRRLADELESERDWPVTTAIVILGHTDAETNPDENGQCMQQNYWDTRGYGPRTDTFTVRGLMACALNEWGND